MLVPRVTGAAVPMPLLMRELDLGPIWDRALRLRVIGASLLCGR